jgi:histidine decarboxylase
LNDIGIPAWRNPQALTVVFPAPPAEVREKWQLASANGQSHLICMPHVTRQQIDELVDDIRHMRGIQK